MSVDRVILNSPEWSENQEPTWHYHSKGSGSLSCSHNTADLLDNGYFFFSKHRNKMKIVLAPHNRKSDTPTK